MEKLEDAVDVATENISARASFRVVARDPLAGGPVELEFSLVNLKTKPFQITVSGDRARLRPGQFSFAASFEGASLEDPAASMPYLGGPSGIVEVSIDKPWRQPLLLNEFLRLERTVEQLKPGAVGRFDLTCRRPIDLLSGEESILTFNLSFHLRRDDTALATLVSGLYQEILQGPPSQRERSMTLVLSLRSAAHDQIEALSRYADAAIAERAQAALKLED
jgi:hypothetical protein